MYGQRLGREFFARSTVEVSKDLLGKILCVDSIKAMITETEAYVGMDDEACHAARGMTKRNKPMFSQPATCYVYLIYGIYHCLNIVTEQEGFPAAVLIRGVRLLKCGTLLDGPGKLCRYFGIDIRYNNIDIVSSERMYILDANIKPRFLETPRIGISKAREKLWRFVEY